MVITIIIVTIPQTFRGWENIFDPAGGGEKNGKVPRHAVKDDISGLSFVFVCSGAFFYFLASLVLLRTKNHKKGFQDGSVH